MLGEEIRRDVDETCVIIDDRVLEKGERDM